MVSKPDILINPDLVFDIEKEKLPFETETIEEVYCSHIIEHISFSKVTYLLEEIYRILAPGGKLFIIVPDLETICRRFLAGENFQMLEWFFGNQYHEGEYHKCGFNTLMLERLLNGLKFRSVVVIGRLNEAGTMQYLYATSVK